MHGTLTEPPYVAHLGRRWGSVIWPRIDCERETLLTIRREKKSPRRRQGLTTPECRPAINDRIDSPSLADGWLVSSFYHFCVACRQIYCCRSARRRMSEMVATPVEA